MSSLSCIAIDRILPKHGSTLAITGVRDPIDARDAAPGQWVQNAISSAISAGGAPFEASNGWMSGGVVSAVQGGTTFNVTAMVCRFTDYTNETSPAMSTAATLGPWTNVPSAYPGSNAVGINVKSDGTILQQQDPLDTSVLYGDYIHVGSLIQQGGTIYAVSNSKYPVADRYALATADFIQHVSPLNVKGNVVSASLTVTDLSIAVSDGQVWQHMSNVTADRTNPSTRYKAAVDRPVLSRIWRNSGGNIIFEVPSQQLDIANYNPDGTGLALVAIPPGYWVNIPILYSPASNSYAMQYPTEAYATEQFAEGKIGKFVRYDSIMKAMFVIGYVTVQEGEIDLTDAEFSNGEFFNYCVYGSSNHTDEEFQIDFRSNAVFVDYGYGDDTEGQLNLPSAPFKTYNPAVAGITSANANPMSQWSVRASGGEHIEPSMSLKPNTALIGEAPRIAIFDASADMVRVDSSFSAPASDGAITSLFCCRFINATPVDLNLYALGSGPGHATSSIIDVRECGFYGDVAYRARTPSGDTTFWVDTGIQQNWRFYGGTHYLFTAICFGAGAEELLFDATNVNTTAELSNVHCKNLRIVGPTVGKVCTVSVSASHIYGTITVDGSGASLSIARGSLAAGYTKSVINGGTFTIYDADLSEDEEAAINSALPAPTAANYFVTLQKLNTSLASKVDTSRTINGHALTSNVVVSASDLTTGTLPHAQLPTLLSADIPATISSNTSGYASSLNGVQTIPSGSTMQAAPALYDDTAAIPTTSWVNDMRGANEGLAQLTGGKVPLAQLPDAITSGLKYLGTWDIAGVNGTVYPAGTLTGDFYIVTGAGTMGYPGPPTTAYSVGDWFVYDAGTLKYDRVPANYPDLSTYTGSTSIHTVGTVTQGAWQGTIIDVTRGGAGTLSGILKGNGGGPVSVASTSSDYVAPSSASTISGDKTFSGNLYATTALPWTATGSAVANASFVQDLATFPQDQLVYVSKVGNDLWNGRSLRSAVKTINQAVYIATEVGDGTPPTYADRTPLTAAYQCGIRCADAGSDSNVDVKEYVSVECGNMRLSGTTNVASYTKLVCRRMDTPTANVILRYKFGTTGAGVAYVSCFRILPGAIVVDANMGVCVLNTEIFDGIAGTNPSFDVDSGSTLYVQASKVSGVLKTTSGGTLDLTGVSEFGTVSIHPANAGTILWPPHGAGNVTGLLKCNGVGIVSSAIAGIDYQLTNSTITLGSDLSGSGSTSINATIANAAVTLAKMANLTANSVIANPTGSATVPQAVTLTADLAASSVVLRDASINSRFNHASETFTSVGVDTILTYASPKTIEVTGTMYRKISLPNATTLPLGFTFKIINNNTTSIDVCKADGTAVVLNMDSGVQSDFTVADIGSSNGSWLYARGNQITTLTGDVSGSGRGTISTTLAPVPFSKLPSIAAHSLLGNPTASPASISTIANSITMTGDVSWSGALGSSTASTIAAGSLAYSKLASIGTGVILGNLTGGTTSPGTVVASMGMDTTVGEITWTGTIGQTSGATIGAGAITLAKMAALPAYTFVANPTTSPGVSYLNLNMTMGGDVQWSGRAGSLTDATISASSITFAKMAPIGPGTLVGNFAAGTTNPGTVVASATMSGDVTWVGTIGSNSTATIGSHAVIFSKMQTIGSMQLLGNSTTNGPVDVATVPMAAVATADTVCIRDGRANSYFNNVGVASTSIATSGITTALAVTSPGSLAFTGTSAQTVTLPDATTVPVGWQVRLFNRSTGTVAVNSAAGATPYVSELSGGASGLFVSTSNAASGGIWSSALGSSWPVPLYTNPMSTPVTASGTYAFTPSDMYDGPINIAKNGTNITGATFPSGANMIAYISSRAGTGQAGGNLVPPVGFSWRFYIFCSVSSLAAAAAGSQPAGVTMYPAPPPQINAANGCWNGVGVVTSSSTYYLLFAREI